MYETYSYSCSARPLQVRAALSASTATRWSSQPATSTTYSTTVNVAKGYSSSYAAGWVNADITSIVKMWAAGTETGRGLALFAGDETDSYGYKKFASRETANDPYVTFTYDRKPNAATAPTLPGVSPYLLDSGITQLFTFDATPAFSSTASDPDNDKVAMTFEVHTSTTASAATLVAKCATGFVASGSPASCSVAAGEALAQDGAYYVRAAVKEDQGESPWVIHPGRYTYDTFGRQTTIPAADAPSTNHGDITLAYYDDDLAKTITQGTTTTTFTLDTTGRRLVQTSTDSSTNPATTTTLTRHYTDSSDNPAWTDQTGGANPTTTRYAQSIAGDLAANLTDDGSATLTLANLHAEPPRDVRRLH